jgi:hypothetical protein
MLHHAPRNAEEASGMTPCLSFVFVSQLTGNPPGANFPLAEMFMNNVPNGVSREIKPYFQFSNTHTSVCLHFLNNLNKISRHGRPTTPLFIHHIHSTTVKLPAPFMHKLYCHHISTIHCH